ncbi:MAG: enoyl-CoA hydratase/isomerase family protein [Pseudomonadales bacterium]|nr:enoyl-CoA hydratase/isomerase family protein [Pseudomonadales bacterium]
MSEVVLFETLELKNSGSIGVITLNVAATLNSLSLDMIDLMLPGLEAWKHDDNIKMVLFQGAGEKAFCAGGDIQNLYHDMVAHPGGPCPYCEAFFEREYRLDHLIHTYPKPTLVWGHGIVMGGGLGILSACKYRIGTEKTRIAMPEITIGLFPDAGATWSFSRMVEHWAYFIAWTGCSINGVDARQVGLIDYLLKAEQKQEFITALQALDGAALLADDLAQLIAQYDGEDEDFPAGQVQPNDPLVKDLIGQCLSQSNPVEAFLSATAKLSASPWLEKAAKAFANGTPTTAYIIHEQFQRAKSMTLEEMFQMELTIAVQCSRHPDFAEGVRALLIDKDNTPVWHQQDMCAVPADWVEAHFNSPWDVHPLADLVAAEKG